tara:strand:+ start:387 stop:1070 length:684 start_codon:yes stop_codon:yes gene_type:complete
MESLWSWAVLIFLVLRAILELRNLFCANDARKHKFEYTSIARPPGLRLLLKALNLSVFVLHTVLLGILFFETERPSVRYWMYAILIYYVLQCYLAYLVSRENEPANVTAARYIIYFSFSLLLLALVALLWDDFCADSETTICDETEAEYYSNLWPLQAIALVVFGVIDCLFWARGVTCETCGSPVQGYELQLAADTRPQSMGMGATEYASAQDEMVVGRSSANRVYA